MNIKPLLISLSLIIGIIQATAQVVTSSEALKRADIFFNGKSKVGSKKLSNTSPRIVMTITDTLQLTRGVNANSTRSISLSDPLLYIVTPTETKGYVVLAGDDMASAILGYSEDGEFTPENIPDNLREWLKGYAKEITYARLKTIETRQGSQAFYDESWEKIPYMINTKWNQGTPYNDLCPKTENGKSCYTGCVATALAQIVNYYKQAYLPQEPETWFSGDEKNPISGEINRDVTVDFSIPIDWESLRDTYEKGYSEKEAKAVATLMLYCGAAVHMMYGSESSGVYPDRIHKYIPKILGYDTRIYQTWRRGYSCKEWNNLIYNELKSGRPIAYGGSGPAGGHRFICDGYDNNGYFHFNFGWGGSSDGNFLLQAIISPSQLTEKQNAIFNICPKTEQELPESPWTFEGIKNNTSQTGLSIKIYPTFRNTSLLYQQGSIHIIMQNTKFTNICYKQPAQTIAFDPTNPQYNELDINVPDTLTDGTYRIAFSVVKNGQELEIPHPTEVPQLYVTKSYNQIKIEEQISQKLTIETNCKTLYKKTSNLINLEINNPNNFEIEGTLIFLFKDNYQNIKSEIGTYFIEPGLQSKEVTISIPDSINSGKKTIDFYFINPFNKEIIGGIKDDKYINLLEDSPVLLTQADFPDTIYVNKDANISFTVKNFGETTTFENLYSYCDKGYIPIGSDTLMPSKEYSHKASLNFFYYPGIYTIRIVREVGNVLYFVNDINGTLFTHNLVVLEDPNGIEQQQSEKATAIWKNGEVHIHTTRSISSYILTDLSGRTQTKQIKNTPVGHDLLINTSNLAKGSYIIILSYNDKTKESIPFTW